MWYNQGTVKNQAGAASCPVPLDGGVELVLQVLSVLHRCGLRHLVVPARPLPHLFYTYRTQVNRGIEYPEAEFMTVKFR